MGRILRLGGRFLLLWVVVLSGFVGRVSADAYLPPTEGSQPAPGAPRDYPIYQLQPSPTGGMGRMAVEDTVSLEVIEAPTLSMKVLVILDSEIWITVPDPDDPSATMDIEVGDGVSPMITGYLDILGIPYDTIDVQGRTVTSTQVITDTQLWDGDRHGHYYAIFVSSSAVWSPAVRVVEDGPDLSEGLTEAERELIRAYERNFGVRRVTWYAFPEPTQYGLNTVLGGTTAPVTVGLTSAGQAVFNYLRPDLSLALTEGFTYQSTPVDATVFTPLLVDDVGNAIVGIYSPANGSEHLVVTTSFFYPAIPPASLHARLLPYGIINWATKGVFLGERRLYFAPQPDDVFASGDTYDFENREPDTSGSFRLTASDWDNLVTWMGTFTSTMPNAADFKIEMPFNGEGILRDLDADGAIISGTLTSRAVALEDRFVWLNHTYSHADLDGADASLSAREILSNTEVADRLGLSDYVTTTLLTGAYTGLENSAMFNTAYSLGIRYILADASRGGYNNPSPNTGIVPDYYPPDLLLVPRLANNIYYYATTPEEEIDYYNKLYCQGESAPPGCYTYEQALDLITNQALGFLLDFNINATMFHMNNLYAYDDPPTSTKTLMGDYVESLYNKYNMYYNEDVPILSLRTQEIGERMWQRMDYNASDVSGIIACSNDITLTVPLTATPTTVQVPVTGIMYSGDEGAGVIAQAERYAGQDISSVTMTPGQVLLVPGSASSLEPTAATPTSVDAVTNLSVSVNGDRSRTLSWDAVPGAFGYRIYRGISEETLVEIAVTADETYIDSETTAETTYAVAAIADDCWKTESALTIGRVATTAVNLTSVRAQSAYVVGFLPLLVLPLLAGVLFLNTRRRRDHRS